MKKSLGRCRVDIPRGDWYVFPDICNDTFAMCLYIPDTWHPGYWIVRTRSVACPPTIYWELGRTSFIVNRELGTEGGLLPVLQFEAAQSCQAVCIIGALCHPIFAFAASQRCWNMPYFLLWFWFSALFTQSHLSSSVRYANISLWWPCSNTQYLYHLKLSGEWGGTHTVARWPVCITASFIQ